MNKQGDENILGGKHVDPERRIQDLDLDQDLGLGLSPIVVLVVEKGVVEVVLLDGPVIIQEYQFCKFQVNLYFTRQLNARD